ncbi:MAG: hypothetical protein KDC59_13980 [Saprospiraceae bacterium]|nr:hypothetical protein [Saprospiraceae bacterium]HPG06590.1 hypothetical protein [Saprospiraceae bacterium]
MLENWIRPLQLDFKSKQQQSILDYHRDPNCLENARIALIGWDESFIPILEELQSYHFPFNLSIVQLGLVRKPTVEFVLPLIQELQDGGIIAVIVGAEVPAALLFKSHQHARPFFNPVLVDERIRLEEDQSFATTSFVESSPLNCFHISWLAVQMHLAHPGFINSEHYFLDTIRLGKIRQYKESIEPAVRDADFLYFNLAAMRASDAPGKFGHNPSGLYSEEASQLTRYAGLSDRLSALTITGYNPEHLQFAQTTVLISQMIWYFLEGYANRKQDYPIQESSMIEYIVDLSKHGRPLKFLKSTKSGRWWLKVQIDIENQMIDRFIPCSYDDYAQACSDEVSDRLLYAFERYG